MAGFGNGWMDGVLHVMLDLIWDVGAPPTERLGTTAEHAGCGDLKVKAGRITGHIVSLPHPYSKKDNVTPSSTLVSTPERIQRFYSAHSTMKNLPMIHKSYMNIQIMYIRCELQDCSISMLLQQQICSILMPRVCLTLYGSRRFTTLAVIIVRFKKSSSRGVKWELDRARDRARINETAC